MSSRTWRQSDNWSLELALKNCVVTAFESSTLSININRCLFHYERPNRIWLHLTTYNSASLDHISMTPHQIQANPSPYSALDLFYSQLGSQRDALKTLVRSCYSSARPRCFPLHSKKKPKSLLCPTKLPNSFKSLQKCHHLHALTHLNLNVYPQDTYMSYLLTCYTVFL